MNTSPFIFTAIFDGPIGVAEDTRALRSVGPAADASGLVGATIRFDGIVRRDEPSGSRAEDGVATPLRALVALDYQSYDPMAERQFESLARDVARKFGLLALVALHSRGRVRVGEVSFVLTIMSAHRAEAIAATTAFIDRLKRDVPIWKSPAWAD